MKPNMYPVNGKCCHTEELTMGLAMTSMALGIDLSTRGMKKEQTHSHMYSKSAARWTVHTLMA